MDFKFCPKCGNKLIMKCAGDDGLTPYCENCREYFFYLFPTCTIALVANQYNDIVLLKQSCLSDKYMTFPAGYMQEGESAEEAIKREIKEEIGLAAENITYVTSKWFHKKISLCWDFLQKLKNQILFSLLKLMKQTGRILIKFLRHCFLNTLIMLLEFSIMSM